MLACIGQWCLVMMVSLTAPSLVTAMPSTSLPPTSTATPLPAAVAETTARYLSIDGTIPSTTSAGSSSESITLGSQAHNASNQVGSYTHTLKLVHTRSSSSRLMRAQEMTHANAIKINELKKRKEAHRKRKLELTTSRIQLSTKQQIVLKNATVMYHRGTVGGNLKVKPPRPYSSISHKGSLEKYKQNTLTPSSNGNKTKNSTKTAFKQPDFLLYHIPSVDPMPEVTSYSPQYTFGGLQVPQIESPVDNIVPLSAVESTSNGYPNPEPGDAEVGEILNLPLGTVDLDLIPDAQTNTAQAYDAAGNLCPSYHLTSNVYGPQMQSRQSNCPDLNVVLNSHYHPSYDTRRPETEAIEAAGGAGSVPLAAPSVPAAAAPAAGAVPAAAPAAGGSGGSFPPLGLPNLPQLPSLPQLSLPDLSGLGPILGGAWNGLSAVFRFIWPFLVAIPVIVFVKTLVATFFALFPWWFPALFLVARYDDGKEDNKHYYYKHVHKPVVHPDGWYWNRDSKTWTNILDNQSHERSLDILKSIDEFKTSYR